MVLGSSAGRRPDCTAVHGAQLRLGAMFGAFRSFAAGWSMVPACTGSGCGMAGLEGVWTEVAEVGMPARAVVEDLDVPEDREVGGCAGLEARTVDALDLHAAPEAFGAGVVVAVAAPAHADREAVISEVLAVRLGRVLAAAVAVVQQSGAGSTGGDGGVQRAQDQAGFQVLIHGPADDLAREEVFDRGEVDRTLVGVDRRDVGDPALIGFLRGEIPGEDIVRHRVRRVRDRRAHALSPRNTSQAQLTHQSRHRPPANRDPGFDHIRKHPRDARDPVAGCMARTDARAQICVATRSRARRARAPRPEARHRDLQAPAQRRNRPLGPVTSDEREPHWHSFTQNSAAFFRISRSIVSTSTSRRRRASSPSTSVRRP